MNRLIAISLAIGTGSVTYAEPAAQDIAKTQAKLMEETEVVAQMGINVPIKAFKSDDNSRTLQIIFLEKAEPGMNTVSEDGEVIFLFEASDAQQSELIGKAFELRARRRLGAT